MTKVSIEVEEKNKEEMNKTEMEMENARPQPEEKKDLTHAEDGVDGRLKGNNSVMSQSSQALLTENEGKKEVNNLSQKSLNRGLLENEDFVRVKKLNRQLLGL